MKLAVPIIICILALFPAKASALPVFAHRYGLSCQMCHTIVPELNSFGTDFMKNGFRLPAPRGTFPVAVKTNLVYSSEAEPGLPKGIVDEIELLSGGAIGKNFNYFVEQYVIDGGRPGLPRDLWLQFNSPQMRVRAGQFQLPLPVDVETDRLTETHYALYDQTVGDNQFNFFDPRIGVDLFTGTSGQALEAHLALLESYDRQSGVPVSGFDRMLSVRKSLGPIDAWIYRYDGQRHLETDDRFTRTGYALSFEDSEKWELTAAMQTGFDSNAEPGVGVRSSGGFGEVTFRANDRFWLAARYEGTFDDTSGIARRGVLAAIFRPARNMRLTIERQFGRQPATTAALLFAY